MTLKSYTTFKKKKKPKKKGNGFIKGATKAIIGVALFSEVAGALRRI